MKTLSQIAGILILTLIMGSCKTTADVHSSKESLDWAGVYKGSTANGGKETIIALSLQRDLTFNLQTAATDEPDKVTISNGNFSWNKDGNEITLKDSKNGNKRSFKAGENNLKETGKPYILEKVPEGITEKYWKLIELNGKPFAKDETMGREPHIILKNEDRRVNANSGCNSIMGTYELEQGNRIKFSQMMSTMMACVNMEIETELKKALETTDNYTLSADGKYLSLNKARMAPLARFELMYLR